jgi:predicted metal-dependent peptidase
MTDHRSPGAAEEKLKRQAAADLESVRVRLLLDQPFIGAILIRQNLIPVCDFRCPTAATDRRNIFVDPAFYFSLTAAERRFLLAHEVWHTVYLHFLRRGDHDPRRFNIAADMEVNEALRNEGFTVPVHALLPPREWRGLNAEAICEKLPTDREPPSPWFDTHLEKDRSDLPAVAGVRPENGGEPPVVDPDFRTEFGDDPEKSVREKVLEAAVQYEKLRGDLPDHLTRIVRRFRTGKLPWRELLAQFVTGAFGGTRRWLPPNRRYISRGLYLQSRRADRLQAVLAVDTSGSTARYLKLFAAELTGLLNSFGEYELTVICCDAAIQSVETYTGDHPFSGEKIDFRGGGGTDFEPVFRHVEKNLPDTRLLLYFTDGCGDVPEPPGYPVIWVVPPDGGGALPWGYELRLPAGE